MTRARLRGGWLATLAVSLVACKTTQAPQALPSLPLAPSPAEAIALADNTKDPAEAADLAWLLGNDRANARQRLDRGLEAAPNKVALLLRRALLSRAELDLSAAVDDLARIVAHAPRTAEAEIALVLLHDWLDDAPSQKREVEKALLSSGLLDEEPTSTAGRVTLATALLARIARDDGDDALAEERLARGGWLTRMRGIGPLSPVDDEALATPSRYESSGDWSMRILFRGSQVPLRDVTARGHRVPTTHGGAGGLYVYDAYFEVSEAAADRPLMLEAHLPGQARVTIDGAPVIVHDDAERRTGAMSQVSLRMAPGWHRIAVAVVARSREHLSLALTTRDGRSVVEASRSGPLVGDPAATRPSVGSDAVSLQGDDAPWGLIHRLISNPKRAVFGRLLGAQLALSGWYSDPDRAWWMLDGTETALPHSAAASTAWARWYDRLDLASLAQSRLQEALGRDPTLPSALVGLALALADEQPERAARLVSAGETVAGSSWAPWAAKFRVLRRLGWNAEAAKALKAAQTRGAPARVLQAGVRFLRGLQRHADAEALQDYLLTLTPRRADQREAQAAEDRGDLDSAIAAHQRAAAHDAPIDHLTRVAQLELARLDAKAAARAAKAVLDRDPEHAQALQVMLQASVIEGDAQGVRAALERLRATSQSTLEHEMLAASQIGEEAFTPRLPPELAQGLEYDVWPQVRPAAGQPLPPGLDPADRWAGHNRVVLLDRVVDRVLPDGRAMSLRHSITRLQSKEATDHAGELALPGDAVTLQLRTLKPDGHSVEVDRHAGKDDLSFSALAPGDAVERRWVRLDGAATPWGGYLRRFYFRGTAPLVRSELVVAVAKGAKVWSQGYNGAPQPTVRTQGDLQIYHWRADEVPSLTPEPHAASSEELVPFVVVAVGLDARAALATNVLGTRRSYRGSRVTTETARTLTATITEPMARAEHLFRFVVETLDHGALRDPELVLTTKRGERTGLYAALLRAAGIAAEVVWARPGTAAQPGPEYPNPRAFSARLVRFEPTPGEVRWASLDEGQTWLGRLPPSFQGGQRILREGGRIETVALTEDDVGEWPVSSEVFLTVDEQGRARGHVELRLPAGYSAPLRAFLRSSEPQQAQKQLQGLAASLIRGARLLEFHADPLEDPLAILVLTLEIEVGHFMTRDGQHLVAEELFDQPLGLRTLGLPQLGDYLSVPRRQTPLLVRPVEEHMRVTIQLPKSAQPPRVMPADLDRQLPLARVTQAFRFDPTTHQAHLDLHYLTRLGRIAPDGFSEFAREAQEVLQAMRNRLVVLVGPPTQTAKRAPHSATLTAR